MESPVPIRRQASAWKNRVLTVGDNDRNEVSCRETASRGSNLPCDQESNTFTAELSVLILFKMIESIDMTLCVISFLVNTWFTDFFLKILRSEEGKK